MREVVGFGAPVAPDPAVDRLIDIGNALKLAEPYIPRPRKKGQRNEPWHAVARALRGWVEDALESAGHKPVTISAKGPLVAVICSALDEIYDKEFDPEAVASLLRRAPKVGQEKTFS